MANIRNYQRELEKRIEEQRREGKTPSLLLHSCCAPCSSYVLEYLSRYFSITLYYYNPNIYPQAEYTARVQEQERLIREMPVENSVHFLEGSYEPEKFFKLSKGLEQSPEGGRRCLLCYELRLREAAEKACELGCDYFTTTLSISPMKDAHKLNEIGEKLAREYHVAYLNSDFKKKNGYKRSVELSKEYNLYRQNYCGCIYSRQELT
ncbi:epoxyqueuosine reductase QueH [Novisyntrophococcus fermenticellae]|uniref:epoxyqueuosine reductase QueH n=1 Tax=Novisyntrophococcus fermenticellae TaxID=2068655 RepID=UPI001E2EC773|nr:epoxyqueuosine reductase QueH [Novisyntrophococcus fermenticellae]